MADTNETMEFPRAPQCAFVHSSNANVALHHWISKAARGVLTSKSRRAEAVRRSGRNPPR